MIEEGTVQKEAADYDATRCRICQLAHTRRCPVPKTAERSGSTVVKLDHMPMGQHEKGRRGEVGSYIFSSRASKMLKVYPVSASTKDAAYSLEEYCMSVLPSLREKVDCIQTDAGTQFNSQEWKKNLCKSWIDT